MEYVGGKKEKKKKSGSKFLKFKKHEIIIPIYNYKCLEKERETNTWKFKRKVFLFFQEYYVARDSIDSFFFFFFLQNIRDIVDILSFICNTMEKKKKKEKDRTLASFPLKVLRFIGV